MPFPMFKYHPDPFMTEIFRRQDTAAVCPYCILTAIENGGFA
ncbi:MAG: hypothetical protein OSJ58_10895 [Dysosmobacter sp.]|nr:hypothetical protein [uncultured Oscillibacter sp.]MCX4372316.1 hypothetical protein [Dysosmobacter sp.]